MRTEFSIKHDVVRHPDRLPPERRAELGEIGKGQQVIVSHLAIKAFATAKREIVDRDVIGTALTATAQNYIEELRNSDIDARENFWIDCNDKEGVVSVYSVQNLGTQPDTEAAAIPARRVMAMKTAFAAAVQDYLSLLNCPAPSA